MSLGDVVDKFLNKHSLSDTGTSEETNFTTSGVGSQQVDDLNTSDEDISTRTLIFESWGFSMDGIELLASNWASFVDGFTYKELASRYPSYFLPMTLRILPKVSGPTGTIIGPPVSTTSCPLTSPSVESKAIVLTLESPRC